MHAITLLQNTIKDYLTLLFVLLPYEFTLLQNELINAIDLMVVLLPCKFTLLQNLKRRLKLLPVHVSQDIQLHLIISPPFCQKHIGYHIYARLFNYPAILHLFRPSKRHLKLLPAQNARNYTTPKPQKRTEAATSVCITGLPITFYHITPFCQKNILSAMLVQICSTTLRFCTSSNVQIGI